MLTVNVGDCRGCRLDERAIKYFLERDTVQFEKSHTRAHFQKTEISN